MGAELTGGRGSIENAGANNPPIRHWLVSLRSYTRYASPDHPWVAATQGLGLSTMDTGLIALTPHPAARVAALNNSTPTLQVAGAVSWPLRRGRSFGDRAMRVNVGLGPDAKLTQPTTFDDAGPPPKKQRGFCWQMPGCWCQYIGKCAVTQFGAAWAHSAKRSRSIRLHGRPAAILKRHRSNRAIRSWPTATIGNDRLAVAAADEPSSRNQSHSPTPVSTAPAESVTMPGNVVSR